MDNLILKPLSQITNEEFIKMFSACIYDGGEISLQDLATLVRKEDYICIEVNKYFLCLWFDSSRPLIDLLYNGCDLVFHINAATKKIRDYLNALGYDTRRKTIMEILNGEN